VQRCEKPEAERACSGDAVAEPAADFDEDDRFDGPGARERDAVEENNGSVRNRGERSRIRSGAPLDLLRRGQSRDTRS